jgi:hypothetical protein
VGLTVNCEEKSSKAVGAGFPGVLEQAAKQTAANNKSHKDRRRIKEVPKLT